MAKKEPKRWKEERRKRAWALYQTGWKQKDIAEALGVTKGAVSQWIKSGIEGGEAALRARPEASEMAVLVFPTPPFCDASEITMVKFYGSLLIGFSVKLYN